MKLKNIPLLTPENIPNLIGKKVFVEHSKHGKNELSEGTIKRIDPRDKESKFNGKVFVEIKYGEIVSVPSRFYVWMKV